MTEQYAVFSVRGGKFHVPGEAFDRSRAWRPTSTACGITVEPQNYYETLESANLSRSDRRDRWLCRHCARLLPS